jgi:pyridoxamine-phosphate oxidase
VLPDRPLDQSDLDPDPLVQFERWYSDAVVAGAVRPDAMALATVAADGAPSVRMVLFKGGGPDGFLFYTNYGSRKARDLEADPRAALVFHWPEMHRQIRVEGTTARVGETESATYFASRPRDAQVAAWASRQSEPLPDRERWKGGSPSSTSSSRGRTFHRRLSGVASGSSPRLSSSGKGANIACTTGSGTGDERVAGRSSGCGPEAPRTHGTGTAAE